MFSASSYMMKYFVVFNFVCKFQQLDLSVHLVTNLKCSIVHRGCMCLIVLEKIFNISGTIDRLSIKVSIRFCLFIRHIRWQFHCKIKISFEVRSSLSSRNKQRVCNHDCVNSLMYFFLSVWYVNVILYIF